MKIVIFLLLITSVEFYQAVNSEQQKREQFARGINKVRTGEMPTGVIGTSQNLNILRLNLMSNQSESASIDYVDGECKQFPCYHVRSFQIDVNKSTSRDKKETLQFQPQKDEWLSEIGYETKVTTDSINQKLDIFTAFWYSNKVPDNDLKQLMTSGHHAGPNYQPLKKIVDYGHRVIPTIGGFNSEMNEFQLRRRIGWYTDVFNRIGWDNIDCIILRDEPYSKGFTSHQLEIIVDEALREYRDVCVTYMFTLGSVLTKDLPDNLRYVGLNGYPFFRPEAEEGYPQVWAYKEFKNHFDKAIENIKSQIPNAKIIISPQVFETLKLDRSPPWRMPTSAELEYYFRYAVENPEIVGYLFWAWDPSPIWRGLSEEPQLQRALENILKEYTSD